MKKDHEKLLSFLAEPHTIEDVEQYFEVSRGTVYRWLEELESIEVKLVSVGIGRPRTYQVEVGND